MKGAELIRHKVQAQTDGEKRFDPFNITPAKANAMRQKNLKDHIRLLKVRYSEQEHIEAVALLRERLSAHIEEAIRNGYSIGGETCMEKFLK